MQSKCYCACTCLSSSCFIVGKGIGSVVTGKLFDPSTGFGPVWTFRFYGIFALAVLAVYALTNIILFRHEIDSDLSTDGVTNRKGSLYLNESINAN